MSTVLLSVFICCLVVLFAGLAKAQNREPVEPSGPFSRRAGQITQLDSVYDQALPANEQRGAGNATIISSCRIITNYHVAFGKAIRVDTKKIVLVKNRTKGHEVNFAFDLDPSGQFRHKMKARVIAFANYMTTPVGTLGDVALLELETCLSPLEYGALDLTMANSDSDVPVGTLMTVSMEASAEGKNQVLVEKGCRSYAVTPIDGLFFSNCVSIGGMSGSAVYELGKDSEWHWTGLTTKRTLDQGEKGSIAINIKTIASFLKSTSDENFFAK